MALSWSGAIAARPGAPLLAKSRDAAVCVFLSAIAQWEVLDPLTRRETICCAPNPPHWPAPLPWAAVAVASAFAHVGAPTYGPRDSVPFGPSAPPPDMNPPQWRFDVYVATEAPPPGWAGVCFKPNPDVLLAPPDWVHVTVSPLALTYPAPVFCPALGDSLLSLTRDSWDPRQATEDASNAEDPAHIDDELVALSCSSDSEVENE